MTDKTETKSELPRPCREFPEPAGPSPAQRREDGAKLPWSAPAIRSMSLADHTASGSRASYFENFAYNPS